jgi:hypothetical protein
VSAKCGNRVVCYCEDCQAFAHFLGGADRILDRHGGTEIFQMSSRHLEILEGADRLSCVRLSGGGLLRWYASCCRTAVANTVKRGNGPLPFVGLISSFALAGSEERGFGEVLGPVRARVQATDVDAIRSTYGAADRTPVAVLLRFLRIIVMGRLRGDARRHPLFDAASGDPIAEPRVLTGDERSDLEPARRNP